MMGHPAEHRLIGFLDGSLTDTRRRAVAAHLADCQRCRDIVQAHRLTRHALGGETAAAPIDVLGRVLATRASGGGVILPVDVEREPRRPPFAIRHLKLGALAAALVAVIVALTRVPLPELSLQRGFDGFGAKLQEIWSHALEVEYNNGPPRLMQRPDAPPTVVRPERMREMTVKYEARHYREGQLISVDSGSGFRVRRVGNTWQVMATETSASWSRARQVEVAILDRSTLALRSYQQVTRSEDILRDRGWVTTTRLEFSEDTLVSEFETSTRIIGSSPNPRDRSDSLTRLTITPAAGAPIIRDRMLRAALMTTVPMSRRWLGSFDRLSIGGSPSRIKRLAERSTDSRRVKGTSSPTLPIGVTPVWEVERWREWGVYSTKELYRQSDGLLAAELEDPSDGTWTDLRLLSVSYP